MWGRCRIIEVENREQEEGKFGEGRRVHAKIRGKRKQMIE